MIHSADSYVRAPCIHRAAFITLALARTVSFTLYAPVAFRVRGTEREGERESEPERARERSRGAMRGLR
jgi:hypothetical protein